MADRNAAARLFRNARREAVVTVIVWLLALTWTVGYCYLHGYQHPADSWLVRSGLAVEQTPENFRQLWGIPEWIWLGIILPWLLCSIFTALFSLFGMKDDDLGTEAGDAVSGRD